MAKSPPPFDTRSRARRWGLAFTLALHLLILWWALRPTLDRPPPRTAEHALKVDLLDAPATARAAPPAAIRAPEPRNARMPALRLPELVIEAEPPPQELAVAPVLPATAAPAAPASSPAATNAAAGTDGGADDSPPGCVPIPYAWLAQVGRMIGAQQRYPAAARQLGHRGTAVVRMNLARDGQLLEQPRLLRSSGSPHLDDEAREVILRVGRFVPLPAGACPGRRIIVVDQPVRFFAGR